MFDIKTSALVLIDLQEGILGYPLAPRSGADIRAAGSELAKAFRAAGGLVVLSRVVLHPTFADALKQPVDRPLPGGPPPPNWAEFHGDLEVSPKDVIINKQNWGAFYGTGLDLQLRRRGINTIILGGVATNLGVESTARDAYERNYQIIFAEEALSSRSAEMHGFALSAIFPMIGQVKPIAEIIAALK